MDSLEQQALLAKEDEQQLNALIEQQRQWILRCASKSVHRYVTDSDDEWSVALLAFAEAVKGYDESKGKFLSFASVVIRRRLTDYLRSEGRHSAELSVLPGTFEGSLEEDEVSGVSLQVQRQMAAEAMEAAEADQAARAREEIAGAQELLSRYGFSFFDLADCSPKAEKTKKSCALAVRTLLENPALLERLRSSGSLPMKELAGQSGVPRKILDRHRKYLIAAAEILSGDFPILAGYMDYIRKG